MGHQILTILLALISHSLFSQNLADSIKYQSLELEEINNIGTIGFIESHGKTFVYRQSISNAILELCLSEVDNTDFTVLDSCGYFFTTDLISKNSLSNSADIDNDGDQDIVLVENGEFDLISKIWVIENLSSSSTIEFADPYHIEEIDIFVKGYPSFVNLNDDEFIDIIISDLHGELTSITNDGDNTFTESDVTIDNLITEGVMNSLIEFSHYNQSYLLKFNSKNGFNLFQYNSSDLIANPLGDTLFKFHYIDPVRNKFFQMSLLDREHNRDVLLSSIYFDEDNGYSTHYYLAYGLFNDPIDNDNDGFAADIDCDDSNPDINPDQIEDPYNGIDDDCDPETLDDDLDQDGFDLAVDCNDNNSEINPNQIEDPYNGIDDDCDPETLDDDLDQDGFDLADDCDDNNAEINPNQIEDPYNGIDDDCNPETLDDDLDQDGFDLADDCDDNNADINPDAAEIPNNGIDEDCDGIDTTTSTFEIANTTVKIYPNPTIDIINIEVQGQLNYQLNLYNMEGSLILSKSNSTHLRVNFVPTGTYILELKDLQTGQVIVEKIIIEK